MSIFGSFNQFNRTKITRSAFNYVPIFFFATHLPHSSLVRQVLFLYTCFKNIHAGDSRQMRPSRCKTGASVRWACTHTNILKTKLRLLRVRVLKLKSKRKNQMYKKRSSKGNRFFFYFVKKMYKRWLLNLCEFWRFFLVCVCDLCVRRARTA